MTPNELAIKFRDKVVMIPFHSCWEWIGRLDEDGYARIGPGVRAARLSYKLANGEIPEGLQIDHLCRNRGCVNPAHLRVVTARENTACSNFPSAVNARKTHCIHGHPFDALNTQIDNLGRRNCRTCRKRRDLMYAAQKRVRFNK